MRAAKIWNLQQKKEVLERFQLTLVAWKGIIWVCKYRYKIKFSSLQATINCDYFLTKIYE